MDVQVRAVGWQLTPAACPNPFQIKFWEYKSVDPERQSGRTRVSGWRPCSHQMTGRGSRDLERSGIHIERLGAQYDQCDIRSANSWGRRRRRPMQGAAVKGELERARRTCGDGFGGNVQSSALRIRLRYRLSSGHGDDHRCHDSSRCQRRPAPYEFRYFWPTDRHASRPATRSRSPGLLVNADIQRERRARQSVHSHRFVHAGWGQRQRLDGDGRFRRWRAAWFRCHVSGDEFHAEPRLPERGRLHRRRDG